MNNLFWNLRWKLVEWLIGDHPLIANVKYREDTLKSLDPWLIIREINSEQISINGFNSCLEQENNELRDLIARAEEALVAVFAGIGHATQYYLSESATAEIMAHFNGYDGGVDAFEVHAQLEGLVYSADSDDCPVCDMDGVCPGCNREGGEQRED